MMKSFKNKIPSSKTGRIFVGVLLVIFGILGFLPVLGFWMIPLGLVVLSIDFPYVRRKRRRAEVSLGRKWKKMKAKKEEMTDDDTF